MDSGEWCCLIVVLLILIVWYSLSSTLSAIEDDLTSSFNPQPLRPYTVKFNAQPLLPSITRFKPGIPITPLRPDIRS
jgi:hypothetical protein